MIDGIRRKLGKSAAGEAWRADEELAPATEDIAELTGDIKVSSGTTEASGRYFPDNPGAPDYYKTLVQTAIDHGGRLGYHSMSIPWLRMILAGLESKQIEPEMMWYGIDSRQARGEGLPEIPAYEDLFHSSRDS